MCLLKTGQPNIKPDVDASPPFINWGPVYKPVRFSIGSQHMACIVCAEVRVLYLAALPACCTARVWSCTSELVLGRRTGKNK